MDKELTGSLFKNKKENEKQPDYTGVAHIEGKTYRVSAWINTAKSGSKYMALRYKEDTAQETKKAPSSQDSYEGLDDEIPFEM